MDYTNMYGKSSTNSAYNTLDKGSYEEYNQRKNKSNSGAGQLATVGIVPDKLSVTGTNIGTTSVDYTPAKTYQNSAQVGAGTQNSSYVPLSNTKSNMQAAGVVYGAKTQNAPLSGMSEGKPTEKISYSDSGKMVDYLYKDENLKNSMDFLIRNDYPTPEDRELNKQLYGEAEEREHLYNVFKDKTNNALNPKLPDETDRLFLSGFLGDEREQEEYDNKVIYALKEKNDVVNQFRNTEFSYLFDDYTNSYMPKTLMAINPNLPHEVVDTNQRLSVFSDKTDESPIVDWIQSVNNRMKSFVNKALIKGGATIASMIPKVNNIEFQREVWRWGAQKILREDGLVSSAWLLEHSLKDHPEDIDRDESSQLIQSIKRDKNFLAKLDEAIGKAEREGKLPPYIDVVFANGDLQYSIHTCRINISGAKKENGHWEIVARFRDKYDFTEIMTCMDGRYAGKATIANDAAVISQEMGAITPFYINGKFTIVR